MSSMKWPAVAMVALVVVAMPWHAAAQDGGTARITAAASNADRDGDDAIRVDVSVTGASNVGAFEVVFAYSDASLELRDPQASFERGPFLGSSGREVFCPEPTTTAGQVRYACVTLGSEPLEGSAGDGLLVSVYFFKREDGSGERRIALSSASVSSPMGQALPSEAATGEIRLPSGGGGNTLWYVIGAVGAAAVVVAAGGAAVALRRRR